MNHKEFIKFELDILESIGIVGMQEKFATIVQNFLERAPSFKRKYDQGDCRAALLHLAEQSKIQILRHSAESFILRLK